MCHFARMRLIEPSAYIAVIAFCTPDFVAGSFLRTAIPTGIGLIGEPPILVHDLCGASFLSVHIVPLHDEPISAFLCSPEGFRDNRDASWDLKHLDNSRHRHCRRSIE